MRAVTRLHACCAATIVFVLYFSYTRTTSHFFQERIHKVWKPQGIPSAAEHRLVVFGDDWSDNGEYRVSPPPKSTVQIRDPDRGAVWTEVLCEELACDGIDNFARSIPKNVQITTIGSVVATDIFANATAGTRNETLALFDFGTQVQQYIEHDKLEDKYAGSVTEGDQPWTLFTVFFGIWDLLEYTVLDKADAVHAIDGSIEGLFHNLDLLADHVGGPIRAVVPKVVDVTFLPRFQMTKNDSDAIFAQNQHQSVFLWTYWNTVLSQAAAEWGRGDIYMPDLNSIVVDQVREKQMYSEQTSDVSGVDKQTPLFHEVKQPCLSLETGVSKTGLKAANVEKCSDPTRHLFWDSIHLSGPAHKLIGQNAALLVQGNTTINQGASPTPGSAQDQKTNTQEVAGFNLKFPPGY